MAAEIDIIILPLLRDNYAYVLHNRQSGENAVIDPTVADRVIEFFESKSWRLNYILNTHHHWDHVGGNIGLVEKYGCAVIGNVADRDRIPMLTQPWQTGRDYDFMGAKWHVIDTPGHTIGHVAFYVPDLSALFCGDTLFGLGCGGLFEGTTQQLWNSLKKLRDLPDQTMVYCGHEYTMAMGRFAARLDPDNAALIEYFAAVKNKRANDLPTVPFSLGLEKTINPFLQADNPRIQQIFNMAGASADDVFAKMYSVSD